MGFKFTTTEIKDLLLIEPDIFGDSRGSFSETYKKSVFAGAGIVEEFTQDNHSVSSKGVLRGIHFQRSPKAQGKLVRVTRGSVWDVAVDLREDSPTYLKWYGVELSEENGLMLYVPEGFGHGFVTLEDDTHFIYKCTDEYSPEHDSGIKWNDPEIGIEWPLTDVEVSAKDAVLPLLSGEVTL